MNNERLIGYVLLGIGALVLLSRISNDNGWIWVGLVAVGFLIAYARQERYSFLVVGSIVAGLAVGLMFSSWGALLISLGIGFFAIDRVEPRESRWPLTVSGTLVALGLLIGLLEVRLWGAILLAILLVALGAYLLYKSQDEPDDNWVKVERDPTGDRAKRSGQDDVVSRSPKDLAAEPSSMPTTTLSEDAPRSSADSSRDARYARLEAWRRETAASEGRAAYLIFNNATLEQIAERNPVDKEELMNIKGVGPVKLERYGDEVIRVLKA